MRTGNLFSNIPPVTKNIIIINFLVWLVEVMFPSFGLSGIYRHLGLHFWESEQFNPIQIITYMFVHDRGNILHIFFNMFTLWMFGRVLEQVWGSRKFFAFYMICGIGAALVQECVWGLTWQHEYIAGIAPLNGLTYDSMEQVVNAAIANHDADFISAVAGFKNSFLTVGASGAIFGLLLGFAFVFPNMPLYLFFIPVPIKAKYMVMGYAVLEFFFGISGGGTIAHFAHLGGLLFGLALLMWWKSKGKLHDNKY